MTRVSAILLSASGFASAYGDDTPFAKAKAVLEVSCVECHTPEEAKGGLIMTTAAEMKSTGEVMGVGKTFGEAFVKSQLGAGAKLPRSGKAFISVKQTDKARVVAVARSLVTLGFQLVATKGTAGVISAAGVPCGVVNKVTEGRPNIVDLIKNDEISMVINTVEERRNAIVDSRYIRTSALLARVTTFTTIAGAEAAVEGMKAMDNLGVISVQEMHAQLAA